MVFVMKMLVVYEEVDYVCVLSSRRYICFQAEDGIRNLVRARGLVDVYK